VDRLFATKSEGVGLVVRIISFQDFQPMWSQSTNVTDGRKDGQTDGRHAIPRPRICTKVHYAVTRLNTRKLCYRKHDRAMRPTYGCPENFRDSLTTPTATVPNIFMGFCSDRPWMFLQNLKPVALPVPEIKGGTPKIWAVPGYAHVAPFSSKFLMGFYSDRPYKYTCQIWCPYIALPVPEIRGGS